MSGDFFFEGGYMAGDLLLVRHGCIGEDYRGRFIGSTDLPLSRTGIRQAEALRPLFRSLNGATCLSSPMRRVRETVEAVAGPSGLQVEVDPDLREIDFGAFEGLAFDEIRSRFPDQVHGWAGLDRSFTFPGGEGIPGFLERIERIGKRIASLESETVAVFAHGGVIRALICHFLGLEPVHYVLFDVDHASVSTIRLFGNRGILACLNDTSHIRGI
jgi:broad specificity phosphatase PhoE